MMKHTTRAPMNKRTNREAGNIFFMLMASIAVIGAMTAGAGNIVKGIVTSMSEVTRKTITEEKMQGGARISIQASAGCDVDTPNDFMEPTPFRAAMGKPYPLGGGLLPENIGATTKDPWGTEYGYCAWNFGNGTCPGANLIQGPSDPSKTVVAVISAGKDRKFSTTCNGGMTGPLVDADCTGKGVAHYNDSGSGYCYFKSAAGADYGAAQTACQAEGGYLATPISSAENNTIATLAGGEVVRLGIDDMDTEGAWIYRYGKLAGTQFWNGNASGSSVGGKYSNWLGGNPDNFSGGEDCAVQWYGPTWQDSPCADITKYVCEIPPSPSPNPATVMDCSGLGNGSHYNDPVTGHCYYISGWTLHGDQANDSCALDGAHLATITSTAEQAAIANLTMAAYAWIGASDLAVDGNWQWSHGPEANTQFWSGGVGGSAVGGNYTNWMTGEPNGGAGENFAALNVSGYGAGKWVDEAVWNNYRSICEKESTLPTTGVSKTSGSDDIVMEYTYNDANGMSGNDLWKINDVKPGSAKIDKDLDIGGGANLSGPLNLMRSGLILPGDADTGACDATTDQQLRINFSLNPPALEICDFAGGNDWTAVSMGGSVNGLPTGAVSYWKMDETTGTTIEDSEGSNDGSWVPGALVSVPGVNGTALDPQSTNFINVPNNSSINLTTYTMSAWVKPDVVPDGNNLRRLFHKGTYGMMWELVGVAAPFCEQYDGGSNARVFSGVTFSVGQWYHLACAYDGTTLKFYVDGVLKGSAPIGPAAANTDPLHIGVFYDGAVDEAMLFKRALTATEIQDLYAAHAPDRPAMPTGYVGYWKFDAGTGATAVDSSGNNLTGTINGATWATGVNGGALSFDGTDDNVDLGSPGLLNMGAPITVGAWVNLTGWGSSGAYFYTNWASNKGIKLGGNGSAKVTNNTYSANGGVVALNSWHYVTTTVDSTKSKVYVDGQLVTEGTGGLTAPSPASKVFIGGVAAPHTVGATNGKMDDVVVYSRALDATEVQQLYQAVGGTVADLPLIAGNFLTDQGAGQCASAGTGPLVKVGTSDVTGRYYGMANAEPYLLAVGGNGLNVFAKNDGSLTRLAFGGPAAAGDNNWLVRGTGGIYVSGTNYHWVTAANQYAVSTFDGVSTVTTNTVASGLTVKTVTGDGRYIYVVGSDGIKAYTNNGSSPGTVVGTYTNTNIYNAWADGSFLYVTRANGLLILKFDGSTFTTVTASVPDLITGASAAYVDETEFYKSTGDGRNIYLVSDRRVMAYTFDGTTLTPSLDFFFHLYPGLTATVSTDGGNVYFANGEGFAPYKWNGTGFSVVRGGYRQGYYVNDLKSDGSYLYVAYGNNRYSGVPTNIDVYSGAGCNIGNNYTAGTPIKQAVSQYSGKITTNGGTSCGIKPDGSLWCWGSDSMGRLGNGSVITADQDVPSRVQDSAPYVKVVTSEAGFNGLRADGTLMYWGYSYDGVLGQGAGVNPSDIPRKVATNVKFVDVDTVQRGACGISTAGDAYCWGTNNYGRLGNGTTGGVTATPTLVSGGKKWVNISVSYYASCGIDTNAQLWCWGAGNRLGNGDTADKNVPTLVPDPGPWRKVEMNNDAACALKQDGSRWCWGYNYRALGLGSSLDTVWQKLPARTTYEGPFVDLSNNGRCAIKIDGTLWCVSELYGQAGFLGQLIGDPGPWAAMAENGAVTVNCGIKTDGSFWCWGYDSAVGGGLGNGPGDSGYQYNPNAVWNMPGAQTWSYDDTGLSISATATANIGMGSGSIGYKAAGPTHDCSGFSNTIYNDPATGHCYYQPGGTATWDNAQAACALNNGYLATITSQSEQNKITSAFGTSGWIGVSDAATEGSWLYNGGELAGNRFWAGNQTGNPQNGLYSNWNTNEPSDSATDKDCAVKTSTGVWVATGCASSVAYICEIGTAGPKGGLSFPSGSDTLLSHYDNSTELAIQATAANTSAQFAWKAASAANTRTMGIDYQSKAFAFELNTSTTNAWLHDSTYGPQMYINTDGRVAVGLANGTLYNKLTLGGGLKVGGDTSNCHVMRAGTLRYVGGAKPYKFCNGSAWVDF
jgi:hypothetical protein